MAEGYTIAFSGSPGTNCYDSDEEEFQGRILSTEELIERLRNRGDFLSFDTDRRLRFTEAVSIICAVITGLWLSKQDLPLNVSTDFLEPLIQSGTTNFNPDTYVERPRPPAPAVVNFDRNKRVTMNSKPANSIGAKGHGGTGSISSRVAKKGIFGALSKNSSKALIGGDLFAQGGFADGIDRIFSGPKGIKRGSGGSVNRMGMAVIGDGLGFGPEGFDGGTGNGVDDLIGNLMAAQTGELSLKTPRSPPARVALDIPPGSVTFKGGRSRSSIIAVVYQNLSSLRHEYNKLLREKPGTKGNVKIRFSIDEFGKVIYCDVVESTIHDPDFERTVSAIISRWRFEKIDKPGDITEIVYPFAFSS
jgi:TonB family protein